MANENCMAHDCIHCLGRLGCEYPENDRPGIDPCNCPDYIDSGEDGEQFDG